MRVASLYIAALLLTTSAHAAAPLHRTPQANLKHSKPVVKHATDGIDTERATQIQTALIKAGYLTGTPSGNWDADSIAAMQKLQDDNGWQTKIVPDARALILLGLGPHPDTPAQQAATPPETPQTSSHN